MKMAAAMGVIADVGPAAAAKQLPVKFEEEPEPKDVPIALLREFHGDMLARPLRSATRSMGRYKFKDNDMIFGIKMRPLVYPMYQEQHMGKTKLRRRGKRRITWLSRSAHLNWMATGEI